MISQNTTYGLFHKRGYMIQTELIHHPAIIKKQIAGIT